jgi:hypothetical protein
MFTNLTMYQLLRLINKTEILLQNMESRELDNQLTELNRELSKRWNEDNRNRIMTQLISNEV